MHQLIGQSAPVEKIRQVVQIAAASEATVLVQGESGTGKEIVANAMHAASKRARGPLVKLNCAAVPETLLESELFGHEKGAFTGADRRRIGRFEQAEGGTLFLDEVCEMHPRLQAKFLRALQEREIERVGGTGAVAVDVRIIAATNRDLDDGARGGAAAGGPVLSAERGAAAGAAAAGADGGRADAGDALPAQVRGAGGGGDGGVTEEAMGLLLGYGWPGNVRELENAIERAVVLGRGDGAAARRTCRRRSTGATPIRRRSCPRT